MTSAYGVEGFTRELHDALLEHGVERVYIAYDADEAGNKAADKLAAELGAEGIEALRVVFPKGMDANEYALKVKPANKALGTLLRAARWMAGPSQRSRTAPMREAQTPPVNESTSTPAADSGATQAAEATAPSRVVEDASQASCESTPLLAAESAEPSPPAPSTVQAQALDAEVREEEVTVRLGDRTWRVRGLGRFFFSCFIRGSARNRCKRCSMPKRAARPWRSTRKSWHEDHDRAAGRSAAAGGGARRARQRGGGAGRARGPRSRWCVPTRLPGNGSGSIKPSATRGKNAWSPTRKRRGGESGRGVARARSS